MKKLIILFLGLISLQVNALTLDLPDGESSDVKVYDGYNKPIDIIYMHGKNSKPVIRPAKVLFEKLSDAGYTVYSAEMPWSRNKYRGTQKTANAIIDQLLAKIQEKGKRAVLMGHSMGGSYAMIYAAQFNNKLAGVVPIALAHVPQMNQRFQNKTSDSVEKAIKMVASGNGKESGRFNDKNKGKSYEIDATAEYYKSFYDPDTLPDAYELVAKVMVPTLWISGRRDRLTEFYLHEELFSELPVNDKNLHEHIKGKHVSVLKFCGDSIIDWLDNL